MSKYNPHDWYWKDDGGKIFSSAAEALVSDTDPKFKAWLARGLQPTRWPVDDTGTQTAAALDEVLAAHGLSTGLTADSLIAYAKKKQKAIADGGFTVNANLSGVALNVAVDTSPTSMSNLLLAVQLAQMMIGGTVPMGSIDWVQDSGNVTLTPQQVLAVGAAVAKQMQQSFTALGDIIAAIKAGTISTKAKIDSPPSSVTPWPPNS